MSAVQRDDGMRAPDLSSEAISGAAIRNGGTIVETDPAKNAAADRIIRILMKEEPGVDSRGDPTSMWGVPQSLVEAAGTALANRYCFAISRYDTGFEEGRFCVQTSPIRFFREKGHCDDRSGPFDEILTKCFEAIESTWDFWDSSDRKAPSPVEAAQYFQSCGFFWDADFQEFVESCLYDQLEKDLSEKTVGGRKITSEDIKEELSATFGGEADEWKRISKTKNEDGEAVRKFIHAGVGFSITVTEGLDGNLRFKMP